MTSIKAKKVILKNRDGEHLIPVVTSDNGLSMFDTVLKDHILTYEESKGLALQGTYVYKDAIAGSRYGYPTFYEKCVEEFQNASNTQEYLSSNVNLVGSVVDNKGVLSGFSTANYATLPSAFPTANTTWEVVFKVHPSVTSAVQNIFNISGTYGGILRVGTANKLQLYLSSNNSSWDIANGLIGTTVLNNNTDYYIKFIFDGAKYSVLLSTDGENYNEEINVESSLAALSSNAYIGVRYTTSVTDPWNGTIDLNESYININGSRWWSGVDTVTRNPNGHMFYDINHKGTIDNIYNSTGRAWMYGVDTENERIFLPRNSKYFRIGDEDTVGINQDAGLPNITGDVGTIARAGQSGAFYGQSGVTGYTGEGGNSDCRVSFNASRSSAIYGNSDTVEVDSVNMLLYICVGNTESEEALTNVTEITTSENDTLPWGYHFYSGELLEAPVGYIESLGQWNDGSDIYAQFFSKAVNKLGEPFAGGYIKNHTETYDDYDLVINQTDMTFRLPLKSGQEVMFATAIKGNGNGLGLYDSIGVRYFGENSDSAFSSSADIYTTPLACDTNVSISGVRTNGDVVGITTDSSMSGLVIDTDNITIPKGWHLYFKVANAVQNLELLNAGEVLEAVNDVVPNNRTVWDGQWVTTYITLTTALAITSGTVYLDLTEILPNDGFNYEITGYWQISRDDSGGVDSQCRLYNGANKILAINVDGNNQRASSCFTTVIDKTRKNFGYEIYANALGGGNLNLTGYRRIGTNV